MDTSLPVDVRWLRWCGLAEGTSTLVLFFIAMPLKYVAGLPLAVTIVGSLHGALFLAYVTMILVVVARHRWPVVTGLALGLAAVIPFGPFLVDRRIPRWHTAR